MSARDQHMLTENQNMLAEDQHTTAEDQNMLTEDLRSPIYLYILKFETYSGFSVLETCHQGLFVKVSH